MIRLFNTSNGEKISEVRRGSESAVIKHLSFDWDTGSYLSCCSDKSTIHIFKTPAMTSVVNESSEESKEVSASGNTKSYFSALSSVVSFAGSEWSFAQLRLEQNVQIDEFSRVTACIKDKQVYTITSKGFFLKAGIVEGGGSLAVEKTCSF